MTTSPVEANVVLTADNSQYDQAMDSSAQSTDKLAKSVDSLGAKISGLTKSAGKKLLGISAADTAIITGATAAWASYEKQMSRLMSQAAIVTHSREQETRVMKDYTESVKNLRKEFGTTTSEAAELTQAISKLAGNTRQIKDLATTFEKMSLATGESSSGLATSLLQLQKMMGTPSRDTQKYADQLTYLAAKSNTSATALADFSAQIAPMGRALGMGQSQVTGFANMFIKAGQDGYTAATAFNKVAQDITYAVQTGNPDLNKYANLLGVTVEHFKGMSGAEQVAGFLDRISQLGPKAAMELNRFGFDGIRMAKAITATVQSSGGAMNAMREAGVGYKSDSVDKGAKAAENLTHVMSKIRQEMQMTAEAFATVLGPGIEVVLSGIEKVAGAFESLMSGPLGKFLQVAAAVLVPITAIGGAMALLAGTIIKLSGAFMLLRNASSLGLKEGLQGGSRIIAETNEAGLRTGRFIAAGGAGATLGPRGAAIANDPRSTWWNRSTYNAGQQLGGGTRTVFGWLGGQGTEGGTQRNIWSRGTSGGIRLASDVFRSQFDQARYKEVPDRSSFLQPYFPGRGPEVGPIYEAGQATIGAKSKLSGAQAVLASHMGSAEFGAEPDEGKTAVLKKEVEAAQAVVDATEKQEKALLANATGTDKATKMGATSAKLGASVSATMRAETGAVTRAFAGAAAGITRFTAQMASSSAGLAASRMASVVGMTPGGVALTAGIMAAPFAIGAVGSWLGGRGDQTKWNVPHLSSSVGSYLEAGGIVDRADMIGGIPIAEGETVPSNVTLTQAQSVTASDQLLLKDHKVSASGRGLTGMTKEMALSRMGTRYAEIADNPQAIYALKLDLLKGGMSTTDTQWVLDNLARGRKGKGMGSFLGNNPYGFGYSSTRGEASKNVGRTFSYIEDQATAAGIRRGPVAYAQQQYQGYAEMFSKLYDVPLSGLHEAQVNGLVPGQMPGAGSMQRMQSAGIGPYTGASEAQTKALDALQQRTGIKATGAIVTGKNANEKWAQAVTEGRRRMIASGMSPQDATAFSNYISSVTLGTGDAASQQKLLENMGAPNAKVRGVNAYEAAVTARIADASKAGLTPATIQTQIRQMSPEGRAFETSNAAALAMSHGLGNVQENTKAVTELTDKFAGLGNDLAQIIEKATAIQSKTGTEEDFGYMLAGAVAAKAEQKLALQMPMMGRGEQIGAAVNLFQARVATPATTKDLQDKQDQATAQMAQTWVDQAQQTKQLLLMQDQYELSRSRAQDDYNLQRSYQEDDFQLSRHRAEEDFERSRARAVADYYRNVRRSNLEFNLQRRQQEADHDHQLDVSAKQQAQSIMDIYQRVAVQRTASADWLLVNAGDQLERMKEQEADLQKLRKMGMTDQAIQQFKLTDPANQQQLARLMDEMTPEMIRRYNRTASQRVKAAGELTQDPSNLEFAEGERAYNLARSRQLAARNRQMDWNEEDFMRSLRNQQGDFNRLMDRQLTDFATQTDRQEEQYNTTMQRAAEDIANVANEITGSLHHILVRGTKELTGSAQDQAKAALQAFKDLKNDTTPVAVDLMRELADIFGFKYQLPKGYGTTSHAASSTERHNVDDTQGSFTGGVIPGWNPGRDTHQIKVGGGESVMRPEWTRAVGGEKAVEQMNHAVIHGGRFAKGGVFWPVPGHDTGTYEGHDGVDINRGSGWDDYGDPIRAFRSGKITYVGWDHGYGDAIFQSTAAGNVVYGHTSAQFVRAGQKVAGGQLIGSVGSTGNSSAPHLHFGIPGGTYAQAMALLSGAMMGGASSAVAAGQIPTVAGLLKNLYPGPERAARAMQGVHPLQHGDISEVLNRYGRRAIRGALAAYGDPGSAGATSTDIGNQPYEHMDNVNIVRLASKRMGWFPQWAQLRQLVDHESGFNNNAQNPTSTAYGMFQFLDSTWPTVGGHKTSDPWLQTKYGMKYIQDRYGSPANAWAQWQSRSPHWYGDGSVFTGAQTIGVGEHGPEAVIPLNQRGGEFLGNVLARSVGLGSSPMRGGGVNLYQTQVDRSTNFTGPITVQANDPVELINKLQARQRVMALSRPALTGSAA